MADDGRKPSRKDARSQRRRARVLEAPTNTEQMRLAFDLLRGNLSRRAATDPKGADRVREFMTQQLITAAERVEKGWTP